MTGLQPATAQQMVIGFIAEFPLNNTHDFTIGNRWVELLLDGIPDRSVLVLLDADDPDFNKANVELAESFPQPAGSRRVYVRMQKRVRIVEQVEWEAEILPSAEPT